MVTTKDPSTSITAATAVPAAPAVAAAGPSTASTPVHCPYRQATLLQQALSNAKMRVGYFLGAGCPVAVRVGGKPLIPNIEGLSSAVRQKLDASVDHATSMSTIVQRLKAAGHVDPNVEKILSQVRALREVVGGGEIDKLTAESLSKLDAAICAVVTDIVQQSLPSTVTPYHQLASWIGGLARPHPVEIFTTNYDLLMEQAFEMREVPYFDGFVGSDRAFFDVPSMEHDVLPPRWARLWKVHGSINWWLTKSDRVERRSRREGDGAELLIHPSHLKYEQSRRMPYLAMLDRLRAFLSRGQAVLVTCGYSFGDPHLNDVILQGLRGNPYAVCFGLVFGDRATVPAAVSMARAHAHINLLAVDGAVIGTVERDWRSDPKPEHALAGTVVTVGDLPGRTAAPSERCKLTIGDFAALGEFLPHDDAVLVDADGDRDAR